MQGSNSISTSFVKGESVHKESVWFILTFSAHETISFKNKCIQCSKEAMLSCLVKVTNIRILISIGAYDLYCYFRE